MAFADAHACKDHLNARHAHPGTGHPCPPAVEDGQLARFHELAGSWTPAHRLASPSARPGPSPPGVACCALPVARLVVRCPPNQRSSAARARPPLGAMNCQESMGHEMPGARDPLPSVGPWVPSATDYRRSSLLVCCPKKAQLASCLGKLQGNGMVDWASSACVCAE